MNQSAAILSLAAIFAGSYVPFRDAAWGHGDPRRWRRGFGARRAYGPLPPSKRDPLAELRRFGGKTYRHRFTGQVRAVVVVEIGGRIGHVGFTQAHYERSPTGRWVPREPRKVLAWLRNAVEVTS